MQTGALAKTMGARIAAALWLSAMTVPSPVLGADMARGQMIIELYCARCHATGQSGASPHKSAPPFRYLSQKYPIESLAEAFADPVEAGIVASLARHYSFQGMPRISGTKSSSPPTSQITDYQECYTTEILSMQALGITVSPLMLAQADEVIE